MRPGPAFVASRLWLPSPYVNCAPRQSSNFFLAPSHPVHPSFTVQRGPVALIPNNAPALMRATGRKREPHSCIARLRVINANPCLPALPPQRAWEYRLDTSS
jgi:hypothetical protein